MIYTMMGNVVERITDYDDDSETCRYVRAKDKAVRCCKVSELKADGGRQEIEAVIHHLVSEPQQDWPA